jgi:hypothetical protein
MYQRVKPNSDTIASFLNAYFSKYWELFFNNGFAKKFYQVFRNGFSHQWTPKASIIAMDFKEDWVLKSVKSDDSSEKILLLNIPSFTR